MRTTVTIDPDTELLIKEEIRRSGLSFKEVLNQGLRRGIAQRAVHRRRIEVEPLFDAPFPPDFQNRSFNTVADELDDEATFRELAS